MYSRKLQKITCEYDDKIRQWNNAVSRYTEDGRRRCDFEMAVKTVINAIKNILSYLRQLAAEIEAEAEANFAVEMASKERVLVLAETNEEGFLREIRNRLKTDDICINECGELSSPKRKRTYRGYKAEQDRNTGIWCLYTLPVISGKTRKELESRVSSYLYKGKDIETNIRNGKVFKEEADDPIKGFDVIHNIKENGRSGNWNMYRGLERWDGLMENAKQTLMEGKIQHERSRIERICGSVFADGYGADIRRIREDIGKRERAGSIPGILSDIERLFKCVEGEQRSIGSEQQLQYERLTETERESKPTVDDERNASKDSGRTEDANSCIARGEQKAEERISAIGRKIGDIRGEQQLIGRKQQDIRSEQQLRYERLTGTERESKPTVDDERNASKDSGRTEDANSCIARGEQKAEERIYAIGRKIDDIGDGIQQYDETLNRVDEQIRNLGSKMQELSEQSLDISIVKSAVNETIAKHRGSFTAAIESRRRQRDGQIEKLRTGIEDTSNRLDEARKLVYARKHSTPAPEKLPAGYYFVASVEDYRVKEAFKKIKEQHPKPQTEKKEPQTVAFIEMTGLSWNERSRRKKLREQIDLYNKKYMEMYDSWTFDAFDRVLKYTDFVKEYEYAEETMQLVKNITESQSKALGMINKCNNEIKISTKDLKEIEHLVWGFTREYDHLQDSASLYDSDKYSNILFSMNMSIQRMIDKRNKEREERENEREKRQIRDKINATLREKLNRKTVELEDLLKPLQNYNESLPLHQICNYLASTYDETLPQYIKENAREWGGCQTLILSLNETDKEYNLALEKAGIKCVRIQGRDSNGGRVESYCFKKTDAKNAVDLYSKLETGRKEMRLKLEAEKEQQKNKPVTHIIHQNKAKPRQINRNDGLDM